MEVMIRSLQSMLFLFFGILAAITATIFTSPIIYSMCIQWFNLTEISGLSKEELMLNYDVILNYLINPRINELNMPFFSMSDGGAHHFAEVKILIFMNLIATVILFILVIFAIRYIRHNYSQILMNPYFVFNLSFPLILLFFIVLAFDKVFIIFHKILFNNDLWLFNPLEDPVITVLPQEYFMLLFILALLIYEAVILFIRQCVNWGRK